MRGGNRLGAVVTTGERVRPATRRMPGRLAAERLLRAVVATPAGRRRAAGATWQRRWRRSAGRRAAAAWSWSSPTSSATSDWERPLRGLAGRHELLAIEVVDPRELELPDVGLLTVVDPETGQTLEVPDRRRASSARRFAAGAAAQRAEIAAALRRAGAGHLQLRTDRDWLLDVVRFVADRAARRQRRGVPMTFQAPVWLLALLAVGAVVGAVRRRCSCAAGATPPGSPTWRCSASLVPKRPGWRRHAGLRGWSPSAWPRWWSSLAVPQHRGARCRGSGRR